MKKEHNIFWIIAYIVVTIIVVYMLVSFIDVIANNNLPGQEIHDWNLFKLITSVK